MSATDHHFTKLVGSSIEQLERANTDEPIHQTIIPRAVSRQYRLTLEAIHKGKMVAQIDKAVATYCDVLSSWLPLSPLQIRREIARKMTGDFDIPTLEWRSQAKIAPTEFVKFCVEIPPRARRVTETNATEFWTVSSWNVQHNVDVGDYVWTVVPYGQASPWTLIYQPAGHKVLAVTSQNQIISGEVADRNLVLWHDTQDTGISSITDLNLRG